MTLETYDLSNIPLYNDNVRALGYPKPVTEFGDRMSKILLCFRQTIEVYQIPAYCWANGLSLIRRTS